MSNVIDLGVFKIQRQHASLLSRPEQCQHQSLLLEDHGDIVRCADCKEQVSAFWALRMLAEHWGRLQRQHESRESNLQKAMQTNLHLVAAQKVEKAWRSRTMVPACPHCYRGIFPEDNLGGSQVNRGMELRRREADKSRALAAQQPANPAPSEDSD